MNKSIDLYTGLGVSLLALILIFIVNPIAVEVPNASVTEVGSVTPRFFPNFISSLILIFGIFIAFNGYNDKNTRNVYFFNLKDKLNRNAFFIRILAMTVLIVFPYFSEFLGILLSGIVLYAMYAIFCGERNFTRAILGAISCILVLYYFFVKIASVPLPLGIMENIL